jgi:hypothetical protein
VLSNRNILKGALRLAIQKSNDFSSTSRMDEHEHGFSQESAEIQVKQAWPFGQFPSEPEGLHGESLEEYKLQIYAINTFVKTSFWIAAGVSAACVFGVIASIVLGIILIVALKPIILGLIVGLLVGLVGVLGFIGLFAGLTGGFLYYYKRRINHQLSGCDRMKLTYHFNFKFDAKARHYISIRDFQ